MARAVKLSEEIVLDAKIASQALNRSIAGQIEYWAKIGKIAENNPDLTYDFIKNLLISLEEANEGRLETKTFIETLKNKSNNISSEL